MTVISAVLPNVSGIYNKRPVWDNLFLFVTARASSGKGRLILCRSLIDPIHDRLREINEAEEMEYGQKMQQYQAKKKMMMNMDKTQEPPLRMLFIPANSSATAVYQVLGDNDGQVIMFETEGDTLANTFASDYGNYSDGFRKAFHHENISYVRRKDREYPQLLGDEIIASVRRLGLIIFRIAMILSSVRMMDDGAYGTNLECLDDDFNAAMTISRALLQHTARVFKDQPRVATQKPAGSGQKTVRRQLFLDALPDEFDRQTFIEISSRLGMPLSTTERNIKKWTEEGLLERMDLGRYKKAK